MKHSDQLQKVKDLIRRTGNGAPLWRLVVCNRFSRVVKLIRGSATKAAPTHRDGGDIRDPKKGCQQLDWQIQHFTNIEWHSLGPRVFCATFSDLCVLGSWFLKVTSLLSHWVLSNQINCATKSSHNKLFIQSIRGSPIGFSPNTFDPRLKVGNCSTRSCFAAFPITTVFGFQCRERKRSLRARVSFMHIKALLNSSEGEMVLKKVIWSCTTNKMVAWIELLGWLDDGVSKSPKRGTVWWTSAYHQSDGDDNGELVLVMKMTVMTVAVTVKTMLMRLKTCWRMTRWRLQLSGWKASPAALEMTPENGADAEESGDYPLYSIAAADDDIGQC